MPSVNIATCQSAGIVSRHAAWLLLLTVLLAGAARAQTITSTTSVTDGTTPSGLQPGSPVGSYELSGFDNVNLYNGNLNFRLPLLKVGGRGSAGYTMMLALNLKSWHVKHTHKVLPNGDEADSYAPTQTGWVPYGGYGAGELSGRSYGLQTSSNLTCRWYSKTLARLTFSAADGTEYELRDKDANGVGTGGEPMPSQCGQGASRGTVFVTADGTSATFISDAEIHDITTINPQGPTGFPVFGYLMLRDGTRYRIDNDAVTWIRDRNGNQVSFGYDTSGRVISITDSINRTVTINYNFSDDAPFGLCDRIVFSGFGGAQRIIRVSHTDLGSALRQNSGYALKTPGGASGLFPELSGSSDTLYDPTVASAVWLPDDGVNHRAYHLYYNPYGELARVELPTGGAVEYDMTPGSGVNCGLSSCSSLPDADGEIYRRVVERRVYPDGSTGPNFEHKDIYTNSETAGVKSSTITVEEKSKDGTVLARSRHYFDGSALDSLFVGDQSSGYRAWYEGNERQTDVLDTAGSIDAAAVLHRVATTRAQRAHVPWWPGAGYGPVSEEPPNDPRVIETVTTIEPSGANLVSKQTAVSPLDGSVGFDQYNNPTDTWEYDYGTTPGAVGAFVRRTHTDYVPGSTYVNADTNPAVGASLRSLPSQQWVSTDIAGNNKASLTTYSYDQSGLTPRTNITGQCPYYDINASQPKGQCSPTGPNGEQPTNLTARGNVTSVTHYSNAAAGTGAITSTLSYDIAGNVVGTTDPLGNTTTTSFNDDASAFCNDNARCAGAFAANTYAFPKSVTSPVPDASALYGYQAGTFGSTTAFTTSTIYDYYTGLVYSATDANGQTTTLSYKDDRGNLDPLDRLRGVALPDGGHSDFNYFDAVGNLYVQALSDLDAGRRTESRQYFDGLGRGVRSFRWENQDTSNPWLTVDTQYDALGRAWEVSNQYRSASPSVGTPGTINPSGRWTQTTFDALGRAKQVVTTADGAAVTTAYSGDKVLVTDQAGKQRMSRSDALGRLTDVWEVTPADPSTESVAFQGSTYTGYHTVYGYDVLGNLRAVTQAGQQNNQPIVQQRSFVYDSLSRLTSATNPESGTVSYTYDQNGNLLTKTDARGIAATYSYDHLNRNIIVTYATTGTTSAATPNVYRYYDSAPNGLGRLYRSEAEAVAQTTFTAYDVMGRPTDCQQKFWVSGAWGQPYAVHQDYNLAGAVISERYPSQHAVSYSYDAAGRLGDNSGTGQAAFSGNLGDSAQRTYSSQVLYDPTGGMNQERFGTDTPVYNKHFYNSRGQLNEIRVSTYAFTDAANQTNWNRGAILNVYSAAPSDGWTASGPDNNGNLRKQMTYVPYDDAVSGYAQLIDNFGYDSLNRLTWYDDKYNNATLISHQAYNYDRWGNRTIDAGNTTNAPAPQFTVDAANRLGVPAGQSGAMTYDAAGNLTNDTYQGGQGGGGTRAYDAENRMTSAQYVSGQLQTAAYAYDADGQRIKRNVGTAGEVWQVYGMSGELLAEYAANASPTSPQKEYGYRGNELLVTAAVTGGWGAAPVIHDNPLVVGQTTVQSLHITELRSAIDALRSHLGLPAYSWQTNASVGALIKADPVLEMRTALDQALGAPSGGYSAGLAQGQPVKAVHIQELRNRVLAAWQGGTGVDVRWLVADQLGTPRVVLDKTGSLAGVSRHDYFPFGEEVQADGSWRNTAHGYGAGDGVRQKFTGYKWDNESGLDFAQARYYASTQGRFSSADSFGGYVTAPQSLNRYAYVQNDPVNHTDPSGLMEDDGGIDYAFWGSRIADLPGFGTRWGSFGELAEREYNERLQNTYDALAATDALRRGGPNDPTYQAIMSRNNTLVTVTVFSKAQEDMFNVITLLLGQTAGDTARFEAVVQLTGLSQFIKSCDYDSSTRTFTVNFTSNADVSEFLSQSPYFAGPGIALLHLSVGTWDYRSYQDMTGGLSMQVVPGRGSRQGYIDFDRYNPYQDLWDLLRHNFLDVIPHRIKHIFGGH